MGIENKDKANFSPNVEIPAKVDSFRFWCQKVLPLVYDDSLSYYELLCKVVNYLNNTIADVNTLGTDVDNINKAYNELQSYVNDYFSTLDVQEEINNKLDEMAENGTLSRLILPLINTPIIVNSTDEMRRQNIMYVLKSNKHIYQWNGTTFSDTGVIFSDGANSINYTLLNELTYTDANDFPDNTGLTITTGSIIYAIKNLPTGFNGGTVITFTGVSSTEGTFKTQIAFNSQDNIIYWRNKYADWGKWNFVDNMSKTIRFMLLNDLSYTDANEFPNNIGFTITTGSIINSIKNLPAGFNGGTVITFSGVYTYEQTFKTQIAFNSQDNNIFWRNKYADWGEWYNFNNNVSKTIRIMLLNDLSYTDANEFPNNIGFTIATGSIINSIKNLPAGFNGGTVITFSGVYTYEQTFKTQIAFNSQDNNIYWRNKYADWGEWYNIFDLKNDNELITTGCYKTFGVIGDSYSSGETFYNGSYHDNYYQSWGQVLARKLGNKCINFSKGGETTRSWLTSSMGLQKLKNDEACDLYWCMLGINDASKLGIDYLGTINDMKENYNENPDTFYGNYGKIIGNILDKKPNATIILTNIVLTGHNYDIFSEAIKNIANKANVMFIDTHNEFFMSDIFLKTMVSGHPTNQTYTGMANALDKLFSQNYYKYHEYLFTHYNGYVE